MFQACLHRHLFPFLPVGMEPVGGDPATSPVSDSPSWLEEWDRRVVGLVQVSRAQRTSLFSSNGNTGKLTVAFPREHGYLLYGK